MITKAYSLRDLKANMFNPPFCQTTPGMAERVLRQIMKEPGSMVGTYPKDFDLYEIGTFDDQTGRVEPYSSPKLLINAGQLSESRS